MEKMIIESYSYLQFVVVRCGLGETCSAVRKILNVGADDKYVESRGAVNLAKIYVDVPPRGGRHLANVLFFEPSICADVTVMFSNLDDGWLTLATCISSEVSTPVLRFGLSANACPWPKSYLDVLCNGRSIRTVMAIKEDVGKWDFFEKGEPLPEEEPSMYRKRLIRDRLPWTYLVTVAERLGLPIGDDRFWASGSAGAYYNKTRMR